MTKPKYRTLINGSERKVSQDPCASISCVVRNPGSAYGVDSWWDVRPANSPYEQVHLTQGNLLANEFIRYMRDHQEPDALRFAMMHAFRPAVDAGAMSAAECQVIEGLMAALGAALVSVSCVRLTQ